MKITDINKNSDITVKNDTTFNISKDKVKLGIIYDMNKETNIIYNISKNIRCEIFIYFKNASIINEIVNISENSHFLKNKINSRSIAVQYNQDINLDKLAKFNGIYGSYFHENNKEVSQININHNGVRSVSYVITRSIVKKGMVEINCISNINKKYDDCITEQDLKTIILSDLGKAWNRPILNINNNNVVAKHGCAIGRVNDEQLYYLMTKGFTRNIANKLIANGFLKLLINKNYKNISLLVEKDINA